jgi:hypothetical protein
MYKKLLVATGATVASAAAIVPAAAQWGCGGFGLPLGAFGCGFSTGFPWMGGLFAGTGLFGFGIPFWW